MYDNYLDQQVIIIYNNIPVVYRGYYMAARGYEFYLRVLKVSAREDKIRIPKRPCNVLFILYIQMKFLNDRKMPVTKML